MALSTRDFEFAFEILFVRLRDLSLPSIFKAKLLLLCLLVASGDLRGLAQVERQPQFHVSFFRRWHRHYTTSLVTTSLLFAWSIIEKWYFALKLIIKLIEIQFISQLSLYNIHIYYKKKLFLNSITYSVVIFVNYIPIIWLYIKYKDLCPIKSAKKHY